MYHIGNTYVYNGNLFAHTQIICMYIIGKYDKFLHVIYIYAHMCYAPIIYIVTIYFNYNKVFINILYKIYIIIKKIYP